MNDETEKRDATTEPLIHEENGERSLHFNFPTIQSRMLKTEPDRLVLDYTRTMMGFLLLQPAPERIAMIGLGGGSLAKYCRNRLPDCDFTAVEISPAVIALRQAFEIPEDDARFRVLCADGSAFVRSARGAFDVLMVDGFDAQGQPAALCSQAFYQDCRDALRDDGILVVNLCADDTGYGRYVTRIAAAFDDRILVVEADEGENKIVFAACSGPFPPGLSTLTARLRALESQHPVELDRTAQKMLQSTQSLRARTRRRR